MLTPLFIENAKVRLVQLKMYRVMSSTIRDILFVNCIDKSELTYQLNTLQQRTKLCGSQVIICNSGNTVSHRIAPPVKIHQAKILSPMSIYRARTSTSVLDNDVRAREGCSGQLLAVLLDVNEGRANRGAAASAGAGEGDSAEVGEGHERVALLEVLNDPLSVLLAESARRRERLGDGLAVGVVLDHGSARLGCGGGDGDGDRVTSAERDTAEVVCGSGEPLEPSWEV
jgi:hypothetical protein